MQQYKNNSGPFMVPAARYWACEIAWRRWGLTCVSVYGVVPVAAVHRAGIVGWGTPAL